MPQNYGQSVKKQPFSAIPNIDELKMVESRVNGGMVTMIDPADIPTGALQLVRNATVRFDRTARRAGSILLTPVKPNSNPVLKLAFFKKKDGSGYTVRMTPNDITIRASLSWNPVVGTLHGTLNDRFQTALVLDEFIFSNNGADPIQKLNVGTATYAQLGNAPNYRYVVGFYNRAVGAARAGINEVEVGWSADGVITEWNPLTDSSAGSSPILESPSDLSDNITGLFALSDVGLLLREKSIWLFNKQPIPTNPFYFATAIPNVGCDSPFSAQLVSGGIAWLDRRTRSVYAYAPGGQLEQIGQPIEKTIVDNIDDPASVFSGYDPYNKEYHVCIPQTGSNFVNVWTYNFANKCWARNDYYNLTALDSADLATAGLQIDQLGDVPIDSLTGTIDELSPTGAIIPTVSFGRADGSIANPDDNVDVDAPQNDYPFGYPFETVMTSKAFTMPKDDMYISAIVLEYLCKRAGVFVLEYSKDGGATDDSWVTAKIITPVILGSPTLLRMKRSIKARRFAWRVRAQSGAIELLGYEVHVYVAGESTK